MSENQSPLKSIHDTLTSLLQREDVHKNAQLFLAVASVYAQVENVQIGAALHGELESIASDLKSIRESIDAAFKLGLDKLGFPT